jgi:hypothetical protein
MVKPRRDLCVHEELDYLGLYDYLIVMILCLELAPFKVTTSRFLLLVYQTYTGHQLRVQIKEIRF